VRKKTYRTCLKETCSLSGGKKLYIRRWFWIWFVFYLPK